MSGIQGRPTSVRLEKYAAKDLRDMQYVTVQPIGSNRNALDAMVMGAYIRTSNAVVEANSTDNIVKLTAHGCKKGDIVRFITTANAIDEFEVTIDKIVDADTFELSAVLSAALSPGDTIDLLRPITQQFTSNGGQVVSVNPAPISYILDGVEVEVEEDTLNPLNNKALPVKLVDFGGDLTINVENLNVQLTHTGATPDSTQIGDGTTLLGITLNNEAKTFDGTTHTKLDTVNTNLGTINTSLGTINTSIGDTNTKLDTLNGTDFATEAKQDDIITELQAANVLLDAIKDDTAAIAISVNNIDTLLGTTNTSLGNIEADIDLIQTNVDNLEGIAQLNHFLHDANFNPATNLLSLVGLVRQDTLSVDTSTDGDISIFKGSNKGELYVKDADLTAKLPASLGQTTMVGSLSVVIASNQSAIPVVPTESEGRDVIHTHRRDYGSLNVTTGAWAQLIAAAGSDINKIEVFDSSGQTLELGLGGVGLESRLILIFPGGNGPIDVKIPVGSRISLRAVSANATEGEIDINFYS